MLPLVYIIATDLKQGDLHVLAGKFRLKPISKPRGWPDVITVFLRSVTKYCDGKLIAVIVSGYDGDVAAALSRAAWKVGCFQCMNFHFWVYDMGSLFIPLVVIFFGVSLFYRFTPSRPTRFAEDWVVALGATVLRAGQVKMRSLSVKTIVAHANKRN